MLQESKSGEPSATVSPIDTTVTQQIPGNSINFHGKFFKIYSSTDISKAPEFLAELPTVESLYGGESATVSHVAGSTVSDKSDVIIGSPSAPEVSSAPGMFHLTHL